MDLLTHCVRILKLIRHLSFGTGKIDLCLVRVIAFQLENCIHDQGVAFLPDLPGIPHLGDSGVRSSISNRTVGHGGVIA